MKSPVGNDRQFELDALGCSEPFVSSTRLFLVTVILLRGNWYQYTIFSGTAFGTFFLDVCNEHYIIDVIEFPRYEVERIVISFQPCIASKQLIARKVARQHEIKLK